jgi:hypothetical protein
VSAFADHLPVRAVLKDLIFDSGPPELPTDPAVFSFLARLVVGPADGPGEESFDLTVCSPEWLSARSKETGIYTPGITSS